MGESLTEKQAKGDIVGGTADVVASTAPDRNERPFEEVPILAIPHSTPTAPKRIQRRRTRGWRMPEDAIYVGRPTVWGNPFWHAQKFHGLNVSLGLYRQMCNGGWNPSTTEGIPSRSSVYEDHQQWLKRLGGHPVEIIRAYLRGHDLACWCPLDQPCHADILLEIANAEAVR